MKSAKGSITKVKNAIIEKLPDGDDIHNFSGISKSKIIQSLDECYLLLEELERQKETFEVIILKRKISKLIKSSSEYLAHENRDVSDFDAFLDNISELKFHIKHTYFLVKEDFIRDEIEISKIKSIKQSLEAEVEKYKKIIDELINDKERCEQACQIITKIYENVDGADDKIVGLLKDSELKSNQIIEFHQSASEKTEVVEELEKQLNEVEESYKQKVNSITKIEESIVSFKSQIEMMDSEIAKRNDRMREQQNKIRDIIDDANRSSMAGSFKTRKDELDAPMKKAERWMTGSLIVLTILAGVLIIPEFISFSNFVPKETINYYKTLMKLPILFPLIWMAWSNSKKYGFLTRIREDYAFKYAAAMAFEGYKKHTSDYDDLQEKLLLISIANMGNNPIRLYDVKNNHASPFNEMFESAKDFLKDIGVMKKKEIVEEPENE